MRLDRLAGKRWPWRRPWPWLWLWLALWLAVPPRAWAGGGRGDPEHPAAELDGEPHADVVDRPDDRPDDRPHDRPHDLAHLPAGVSGKTFADDASDAGDAGLGGSAGLARQLVDQTQAVDHALAAVADKLAAAQVTARKRLRAAYRLLHAVPGEDAMGVARRRAAAGLLLARDGGERGLLVAEAAQLRAAHDRIAAEAAQLPSIRLPVELARPAPGTIARRFGTLAHERSKATLSRRGIDLEVDDRSPVTAPAAGTVRYAGPIRGLDQGVIIDHGSYLTVIAKLAEVALPVGAPLAAGDRIGRAARHRVYLEVRVKLGPGGLPIDPEPLLGKPR